MMAVLMPLKDGVCNLWGPCVVRSMVHAAACLPVCSQGSTAACGWPLRLSFKMNGSTLSLISVFLAISLLGFFF